MGVQMKDQVSPRSQLMRAKLKADIDGPGALMRLHMGGQMMMMMIQVGGTATIGETAEKMLSKSVLLSDTFWATHSRAAANGVTDAPEKGGVVACTEGPGPVASVTMLMLTCSCGPGALMGIQMKDQVSPRSQRVRAQLKADIDGPGALIRLHMGGQVSSCSQRLRSQLKADMDGPGALMRLHMGGRVTLIMWP
jgi:hypothetical protein